MAETLVCPDCGSEVDIGMAPVGQRLVCPKCGVWLPAVLPSGEAHGKANVTTDASQRVEADDAFALQPARGPGELGRLGPYRVLQVLGRGGMGMVYLAEDPRLQRQIALKVMLPQADGAQARRRFLREAQAQAALDHDHVVPIYQVDEDHGVPFLAMPLLKGETLADCLERGTKLPLPEVLRDILNDWRARRSPSRAD